MAQLEIERKWLFQINPISYVFAHPPKESHTVFQWYIVATDDAQVRISQRKELMGDRYTLNIKNGNGLTRKKVRVDVTYKDFLALVGQCDKVTPIKKDLYVFYLPDNHLLEISQVDNDWWYAEVEFKSEEDTKEFDISKFVDCRATEVTGDSNWSMKNYWRRTRLMEN